VDDGELILSVYLNPHNKKSESQKRPTSFQYTMNTHNLPSIFVSHGSPMIALQPGAAGAFMRRLGGHITATFGRPRAILIVSAHSTARRPVLLAAAQHRAVYDFGGFDPRLNQLRYDAPGDPALAAEVADLLTQAELPHHVLRDHELAQGGLDHGAWTALRYLFPAADIPVLPLAFVPSQSPAQQFTLGEALQPLRDDGVLVIGSGSITHNLGRVFVGGGMPAEDAPEIAESAEFREWMAERSAARDWDALFNYRTQAPFAVDMHPTDEHLLPWFVAAGAGGRAEPAVRLHSGVSMGCLGMDAYAFGATANDLLDTASAESTVTVTA
jgi:4,5-DOPA dioxygenase extradiol